MSNPYKPFASQLFHTLNKKNLREMRNQQFKYTESWQLPLKDSAAGFIKSDSSSKSSSLISSTWSSTRASESVHTEGLENESLDDDPTSKFGVWAENILFEELTVILQNPASFRFAEILRSDSSFPQTIPHGFIILMTSDKRSNECDVVCGSNKLERTTLKVDFGWPAIQKQKILI